MNFSVDLGQLIIGGLISTIGLLIKSEIRDFKNKLTSHEAQIHSLISDVQILIGKVAIMERWNGNDRRIRNED